MAIRVQDLSDEELEKLRTMARSRTLGAGLVWRAQIVLHSVEGLTAPTISERMRLCGETVRHWLKRFKARGFDGLEENVRSGRPPTYTAAERSAVIDTALTPPAELGLPFASWKLDRLVAHLSERGIGMTVRVNANETAGLGDQSRSACVISGASELVAASVCLQDAGGLRSRKALPSRPSGRVPREGPCPPSRAPAWGKAGRDGGMAALQPNNGMTGMGISSPSGRPAG